MKRILFLAALLLPMVVLPVRAVDVERAQWDSVDVPALEAAAGDTLGEVHLQTEADLDGGLKSIWEALSGRAGEVVRASIKSGALLLLVVLLCGVGEVLGRAAGGTALPVIQMAGAVTVAGAAVLDMRSLIGLGAETINQLSTFSAVLLPVMTSAAAACGHPTGATVRQMVTLLCGNVLAQVIDRVLIPMTYVYVAASTAAAALESDRLQPLCRIIKWGICSVLTALLLAYVGYITVSGAVTAGTDQTAVKMTKLAISGMVPVVGSVLSDATETVLAGAGALRNAVGVFGMLAVLGICALPFLRLGCQYLMYKLVGALSATISRGGVARLIGELGSVFGLVLGMAGTCAFVLLMSLTATISVAAA